MANYCFSSLRQQFNFGKNSGSTLEDILDNNPGYVRWCMDNINDFCMSPDLICEIKDKYPMVTFPNGFEDKYYDMEEEDDEYIENDDYGSHYGEFTGTYAQDIMGYSDDVINDAFEGDPDAYWNID